METEHPASQTNQDPLEAGIQDLIKFLGDDPAREGLQETPKRVIKALQELTSGYKKDPIEVLGTVFMSSYDEMIVEIGIPFVSLCEHHCMPFWGEVTVGYIPSEGRIVGLSKIPRLIEIYSRRLQIQERLTQQIAEALYEHPILHPRGVGVIISARHSCMEFRGVKKQSETMTSYLFGDMRDDASARNEFLAFLTLKGKALVD